MKIKKITDFLEQIAPLGLQESYDNSGLLIGSPDKNINKALISLDVTEEVMDEAIKNGCDLIISHHPLIFKGLKKLNGGNLVENLVVKAIKNDVAIYAIHTNLDNISGGVNGALAKKIGLKQTKVLYSKGGELNKLVVFCPQSHAEEVRNSMLDAGAGHIGNYSHCSYNTEGQGSFKAGEGADPYVGEIGKTHFENEIRIETIVPRWMISKVINAMLEVHPYEEVAYDIYPLTNKSENIGSGLIGILEKETDIEEFLKELKMTLQASGLRHGPFHSTRKVKKVAICGGSGSFLMEDAYRQGADLFVTADLKYHDFFLYHGEMTLVDAGHYETEQFTKELLFDLITKKFPNFALRISNMNTNPVSFM
ncbi:MAG: Nif3-like dinuclear metal center hexameric protein [Bacteroidales bacterium]|nr:Nif3-like dinuclear metal center hexameric protein [Bacteroidales bacterium]